MIDVDSIHEHVDAIESEIIRWRRHIHENPELSFKEEKTGAFVADALRAFGDIDVLRPVGHSVLGRIHGNRPGKVLALRADMDALPIHEESSVDFCSKNAGVMHACGHDAHTAILLGTAKILAQLKHRFDGEVRLLFQHAEEMPPGGAAEMVEAGVMEGVNFVIGAHLQTPLDCGKIGVTYGPMMAAPDIFRIQVRGTSGHAARPQDSVDSIAIASQVVTNLQHVVARNVDPMDNLVVSVTKFHAGSTHNVIPDVVEIEGTVRSFNPSLREAMPATIARVIRGITQAHGAQYEFEYVNGYAPVINDPDLTSLTEEAVGELFGSAAVAKDGKRMGGEDFSRYQAEAPGVFFDVGARNESLGAIYPHHSSRFMIDERCLGYGAKTFLHVAGKVLASD